MRSLIKCPFCKKDARFCGECGYDECSRVVCEDCEIEIVFGFDEKTRDEVVEFYDKFRES